MTLKDSMDRAVIAKSVNWIDAPPPADPHATIASSGAKRGTVKSGHATGSAVANLKSVARSGGSTSSLPPRHDRSGWTVEKREPRSQNERKSA
jgi:hypothetical protein